MTRTKEREKASGDSGDIYLLFARLFRDLDRIDMRVGMCVSTRYHWPILIASNTIVTFSC